MTEENSKDFRFDYDAMNHLVTAIKLEKSQSAPCTRNYDHDNYRYYGQESRSQTVFGFNDYLQSLPCLPPCETFPGFVPPISSPSPSPYETRSSSTSNNIYNLINNIPVNIFNQSETVGNQSNTDLERADTIPEGGWQEPKVKNEHSPNISNDSFGDSLRYPNFNDHSDLALSLQPTVLVSSGHLDSPLLGTASLENIATNSIAAPTTKYYRLFEGYFEAEFSGSWTAESSQVGSALTSPKEVAENKAQLQERGDEQRNVRHHNSYYSGDSMACLPPPPFAHAHDNSHKLRPPHNQHQNDHRFQNTQNLWISQSQRSKSLDLAHLSPFLAHNSPVLTHKSTASVSDMPSPCLTNSMPFIHDGRGSTDAPSVFSQDRRPSISASSVFSQDRRPSLGTASIFSKTDRDFARDRSQNPSSWIEETQNIFEHLDLHEQKIFSQYTNLECDELPPYQQPLTAIVKTEPPSTKPLKYKNPKHRHKPPKSTIKILKNRTVTTAPEAPDSNKRPKRVQVKAACSNCRKSCKKCSNERPCMRCVSIGAQDTCIDVARKVREVKENSKRRRPKIVQQEPAIDKKESDNELGYYPYFTENYAVDDREILYYTPQC